jgi:hypothetical protein
MAEIPSPLVREEVPELDNGTIEHFPSDPDVEDASTNSPPEDYSTQRGKKSFKSPVYGSDNGSPFLEDGLPVYDSWTGRTDAELDDNPFTLTEPAYPILESGRSRLSSDWLQILQEGNKRYALRNTDRSTFRGSGFQDIDKSGDYRPDLKPARSERPQKGKPNKNTKVEDPPATSETSPESVKAGKKRKPPPKKRTTKAKVQLHASNYGNSSSLRQGRWPAKQKKPHEKPRAQKINFKFDSDLESAKPKFSASVPGGKIMHITTSYCHPIKFNWIPPAPLSPSPYSPPKSPSEARASPFPCHFCTDPGLPYALAGLGSKRVEVIQWEHDPTAGYEELENGWVQAGEEGTRMCIQCTMERVMICLCTDHEIRPIKGLDPKTFDFEAAIGGVVNQTLNRGKPDHGKVISNAADVTEVRWCSICIEPAFFECCVRPAFTTSGLETSPADDIGCGLLLCEVCASRMRGRHQHRRSPPARLTAPESHDAAGRKSSDEPFKAIMTLDEHISAASKDTFHYQDGLRADVCFVKADSELMRRQGAGGEDAAGDGDNEEEIDTDEEPEYDEFQDRGFKKRNWGMGSPIDLT